jgi:hypothetical protein
LKNRDADLAEKIARTEATNAAKEIMRLFEEEDSDTL